MKIKKLDDNALLPRYSTEGSSGFDLFTYKDVEWEQVGSVWIATIPTGWAFEIDREHGMFLLSRSSQGFSHLTHLVNCVGLVDFDFRKQCMVKLMCHLAIPPVIKKGDAICQAVILETPRMFFEVVQELSKPVDEHAGFGSTSK